MKRDRAAVIGIHAAEGHSPVGSFPIRAEAQQVKIRLAVDNESRIASARMREIMDFSGQRISLIDGAGFFVEEHDFLSRSEKPRCSVRRYMKLFFSR